MAERRMVTLILSCAELEQQCQRSMRHDAGAAERVPIPRAAGSQVS